MTRGRLGWERYAEKQARETEIMGMSDEQLSEWANQEYEARIQAGWSVSTSVISKAMAVFAKVDR